MSIQKRIPLAQLVAVTRRALEEAGVPSSIASIEAEVMTESDLMGVASHGVRMLPRLLAGIREGKVSPHPSLRTIKDFQAVCVLDGDNGPGRYVCVEATKHAVDRAKKFGIGACLAQRVTHWGRGFAYALRATQANTIGLCMSNSVTNMVAWGSSQPLLGNNPLAIGVPQKEKNPIILDMAMSQAAIGKVVTYLREGRETPPGWGQDKQGNPTTNPKTMLESKRILPFGEHKGAGLAVMIELLTGALAGVMLSQEILAYDPSGLDPQSTKLFIALDVQAVGALDSLTENIEKMRRWMEETEPGIDILFPGDTSWKNREIYLRDGIPLRQDILHDLEKVNIRL